MNDLQTDFNDSFSTQTWKSIVQKELKEKAYADYLIWKSLDGFEIESWQNELPIDRAKLVPLTEPWKITEPIFETDAKLANTLALNALNSGAEAIWFDKSFHGAAADVATHGIDQHIARVFVRENTWHDPFKSLLHSGISRELNNKTYLLNGLRMRERGANAVQEIGFVIAQFLELLETKGAHLDCIVQLGYGSSFITETAKTRAFRWLWRSVLEHEGLPAQNPTIIATNAGNEYSQHDEHTNILRGTSAAMSAAVGGVSFIMIRPWDRNWRTNNDFSARVSRNIQTLLKDEARLDKNLNPADGSFFIENLTTAMAKAAWQLVQKIQTKGGFSQYAISGQLKAEMEQARYQQLDAYRGNGKTLLGINKFKPTDQKVDLLPIVNEYALLPDYFFIPTEIQVKTP